MSAITAHQGERVNHNSQERTMSAMLCPTVARAMKIVESTSSA